MVMAAGAGLFLSLSPFGFGGGGWACADEAVPACSRPGFGSAERWGR